MEYPGVISANRSCKTTFLIPVVLAIFLCMCRLAAAYPDFAPSTTYLNASMLLDTLHRIDPCLIEEGTISGIETPRRILRFGSMISNLGPDDYLLGQVPASRTGVIPPYWQWSDCHGHWHFLGYARYTLVEYVDPSTRPLAESLTVIAPGHKMGFCVSDLLCSTGVTQKFTCTYQGITAKCADMYHAMLDGQWIDLTGIDIDPKRKYSVAINANPSFDILEEDYSNNVALATVVFGDLPGYDSWGTARGSSAAGVPAGVGTGGAVAGGPAVAAG